MEKKTILITGATTGIGRHAALFLARRGHRVFATGRNEAALARLALEAEGTSLEILRLDVTSAASIEAARAEVDRRTGGRGLDALVNNAGFGIAAPTELLSDADLRSQFETNVFGLMAVTRAFLPAMHERGRGRVVNVSSVGGRVTLPMYGGYNATKYAVESLSDALRRELGPLGIDVVLIEPGVIKSEFIERSMTPMDGYAAAAAGRYGRVLQRWSKIRALSEARAADPRCVARAMARAIEARRPRARYVTPLSARLMLAFAQVLPTRLVDLVMRLAIGHRRPRLGARAGSRSMALQA